MNLIAGAAVELEFVRGARGTEHIVGRALIRMAKLFPDNLLRPLLF
jgi:hypothetical protein